MKFNNLLILIKKNIIYNRSLYDNLQKIFVKNIIIIEILFYLFICYFAFFSSDSIFIFFCDIFFSAQEENIYLNLFDIREFDAKKLLKTFEYLTNNGNWNSPYNKYLYFIKEMKDEITNRYNSIYLHNHSYFKSASRYFPVNFGPDLYNQYYKASKFKTSDLNDLLRNLDSRWFGKKQSTYSSIKSTQLIINPYNSNLPEESQNAQLFEQEIENSILSNIRTFRKSRQIKNCSLEQFRSLLASGDLNKNLGAVLLVDRGNYSIFDNCSDDFSYTSEEEERSTRFDHVKVKNFTISSNFIIYFIDTASGTIYKVKINSQFYDHLEGTETTLEKTLVSAQQNFTDYQKQKIEIKKKIDFLTNYPKAIITKKVDPNPFLWNFIYDILYTKLDANFCFKIENKNCLKFWLYSWNKNLESTNKLKITSTYENLKNLNFFVQKNTYSYKMYLESLKSNPDTLIKYPKCWVDWVNLDQTFNFFIFPNQEFFDQSLKDIFKEKTSNPLKFEYFEDWESFEKFMGPAKLLPNSANIVFVKHFNSYSVQLVLHYKMANLIINIDLDKLPGCLFSREILTILTNYSIYKNLATQGIFYKTLSPINNIFVNEFFLLREDLKLEKNWNNRSFFYFKSEFNFAIKRFLENYEASCSITTFNSWTEFMESDFYKMNLNSFNNYWVSNGQKEQVKFLQQVLYIYNPISNQSQICCILKCGAEIIIINSTSTDEIANFIQHNPPENRFYTFKLPQLEVWSHIHLIDDQKKQTKRYAEQIFSEPLPNIFSNNLHTQHHYNYFNHFSNNKFNTCVTFSEELWQYYSENFAQEVQGKKLIKEFSSYKNFYKFLKENNLNYADLEIEKCVRFYIFQSPTLFANRVTSADSLLTKDYLIFIYTSSSDKDFDVHTYKRMLNNYSTLSPEERAQRVFLEETPPTEHQIYKNLMHYYPKLKHSNKFLAELQNNTNKFNLIVTNNSDDVNNILYAASTSLATATPKKEIIYCNSYYEFFQYIQKNNMQVFNFTDPEFQYFLIFKTGKLRETFQGTVTETYTVKPLDIICSSKKIFIIRSLTTQLTDFETHDFLNLTDDEKAKLKETFFAEKSNKTHTIIFNKARFTEFYFKKILQDSFWAQQYPMLFTRKSYNVPLEEKMAILLQSKIDEVAPIKFGSTNYIHEKELIVFSEYFANHTISNQFHLPNWKDSVIVCENEKNLLQQCKKHNIDVDDLIKKNRRALTLTVIDPKTEQISKYLLFFYPDKSRCDQVMLILKVNHLISQDNKKLLEAIISYKDMLPANIKYEFFIDDNNKFYINSHDVYWGKDCKSTSYYACEENDNLHILFENRDKFNKNWIVKIMNNINRMNNIESSKIEEKHTFKIYSKDFNKHSFEEEELNEKENDK